MNNTGSDHGRFEDNHHFLDQMLQKKRSLFNKPADEHLSGKSVKYANDHSWMIVDKAIAVATHAPGVEYIDDL